MNWLEALYVLSLGVVVGVAFLAAALPAIRTGIVGTSLLCVFILCNMAGWERFGETPNWRALLTITEAGLAVYAFARWLAWEMRE